MTLEQLVAQYLCRTSQPAQAGFARERFAKRQRGRLVGCGRVLWVDLSCVERGWSVACVCVCACLGRGGCRRGEAGAARLEEEKYTHTQTPHSTPATPTTQFPLTARARPHPTNLPRCLFAKRSRANPACAGWALRCHFWATSCYVHQHVSLFPQVSMQGNLELDFKPQWIGFKVFCSSSGHYRIYLDVYYTVVDFF